MAEQSKDTDGVDNERLAALCKSRAGYAANVTKAYNRLIHYTWPLLDDVGKLV